VIFGLRKKVMLPAGLIDRVDREKKTIHVNKDKGEIKEAPEFDESQYRDNAYRDRVSSYYGRASIRRLRADGAASASYPIESGPAGRTRESG